VDNTGKKSRCNAQSGSILTSTYLFNSTSFLPLLPLLEKVASKETESIFWALLLKVQWRKKYLHVFSEGFLKNLRKMKTKFIHS